MKIKILKEQQHKNLTLFTCLVFIKYSHIGPFIQSNSFSTIKII